MMRFLALCALLFAFSAAPSAQVITSTVTITQNGPAADPTDFIEFFLTASPHPCPPVLSNCVADDFCGSGIIDCDSLTAPGMAAAIAAGLTASALCPPGVTVTAAGNVLTITNDKSVSGVDVFCCINMIECPAPFGYGLGGPGACVINNVCSGVCGDEDAPPGAFGFNFEKTSDQIVTSVVLITQNGPAANPTDFIEFFLEATEHPCAPVLSDCFVSALCGSGLINCDVLTPEGMATAIASGLTAAGCPPGVTVTAAGAGLTITNDRAISGLDVFCCINMIECGPPFGYGLGGTAGCAINNVCSGVCGDEGSPPGALGFNFRKIEACTGPLPSSNDCTSNTAVLVDNAGTIGFGPNIGDPSESYGVSLDCSNANQSGVYRIDIRAGFTPGGIPSGFGLICVSGPLLTKFTGLHADNTVNTPTLTLPNDVTFACLPYTNQGWCQSMTKSDSLSNAVRETIGIP
jgi:hypothetical protein